MHEDDKTTFGTSAMYEGDAQGYLKDYKGGVVKGMASTVEDTRNVALPNGRLIYVFDKTYDLILKHRGKEAADAWKASRRVGELIVAEGDLLRALETENAELFAERAAERAAIDAENATPPGRLYITVTERDTGKTRWFYADPPQKKTFWQKIKSFFTGEVDLATEIGEHLRETN